MKNEDMLSGGLGFGGQSPVIQVAGAQRALTREPRAILEEGDYDTNVSYYEKNNFFYWVITIHSYVQFTYSWKSCLELTNMKVNIINVILSSIPSLIWSNYV